MIPASFEYAVARDIPDAIQLLASSGAGSDQTQRVLQAWQDAVRQAMQSQSDWTQRWAEAARQSAPEAKERGSRR